MVVLASSQGWFWKDKPDSKFTRKRDMKNMVKTISSGEKLPLLPQQQVGFRQRKTGWKWLWKTLRSRLVADRNPAQLSLIASFTRMVWEERNHSAVPTSVILKQAVLSIEAILILETGRKKIESLLQAKNKILEWMHTGVANAIGDEQESFWLYIAREKTQRTHTRPDMEEFQSTNMAADRLAHLSLDDSDAAAPLCIPGTF
ncbi:hypothetical protein R1flu_012642 [Riccia fluitans]|uniref:Uncharacterized protein n=1 Tax=Riccia fluitans TaxID=41844 RepID=A0ABD1ZBC7_9MARC